MSKLPPDSVFRLQSQYLLEGDNGLVLEVAKHSSLTKYDIGECLITQGLTNKYVHFLLEGSVTVRINNQKIATRNSGQSVGELSLLHTAPATASVYAATKVVSAMIPSAILAGILDKSPIVWKKLAKETAGRLAQRGPKIDINRDSFRVFLASAGEDSDLILKIGKSLNRRGIECMPWVSPAAFPLSATFIESLVNATKTCDGAIVVLSSIDSLRSRGKSYRTARDNVVFEAGLFTGALGRDRVACLLTKDTKIPSDLLGVTTLPFSPLDINDRKKYNHLIGSLVSFVNSF